jgi:predicted molibdopterin-dependent oxidoreductase YjgC
MPNNQQPLRIAGTVERSEPVTISVDGRAVPAFAGESLAAALFAAGVRQLRASPRAATPRGMFCLMGVCQECVLWVDGRRTPACREPVRDGMTVSTGPTP